MTLSRRQGDQIAAYRARERDFIKSYIVVVAISMVLCFISRAPDTLEKVGIGDVGLKLNVGYVVIFGPPLLLALIAWRSYEAWHLGMDRSAVPDAPSMPAVAIWVSLLFFLLPAVAGIFLLIQFVYETREPGGDCGAFGRARLFWDTSLRTTAGWRFEYCFGVDPDMQKRMPYAYPPWQTWGYVLCNATSFWLCVKIWRIIAMPDRAKSSSTK